MAALRANKNRSSSRVLMLLALSLGCREGCICRRLANNPLVQSAGRPPPPEQVQRDVTAALSTDAEVATNLCGMQVTGLANVTVVVDPPGVGISGSGRVHVRGNPLFNDGGVNVAGLVCIGVVACAFTLAVNSDHRFEWRFASLSTVSVETPGVHWEAPPVDTTHHSSHHHHHHH